MPSLISDAFWIKVWKIFGDDLFVTHIFIRKLCMNWNYLKEHMGQGVGRSRLSAPNVGTTKASFSIIHSVPPYITNHPLASVGALHQLKVFRFWAWQ